MSPHFRYRVLPRFLWAGGAAVVVAVALIVVARSSTNGDGSNATTLPTARASTPAAAHTPRAVPVTAAESRVVLRFVKTAVMREHASRATLLEGWKLTGPKLKQGTSLAEWLEGTSSVTPFPDGAVAPHLRVDRSTANDSLLELALYPKRQSSGVPAGVFLIGLHRYGLGKQARWLVDYWAPHGSSSMPAAAG